MKRFIAVLLIVVFVISFASCGKGDNSESSTTAVDSVTVSKEKLMAVHHYFQSNPWIYSDEDTKVIDGGYALVFYDYAIGPIGEKIQYINNELGIPSSVYEMIISARPIDGMQTRDCGEFSVSWLFDGDCIKIIYEINK